MLKDNIALLRNFVNISQRELGRRIDMTGQYIAKIEKGERMPTTETLNKIVSALSDNTFGRQFYIEELTFRPYTLIELIHKSIINKKVTFQFLRHHSITSTKQLTDMLSGLIPPNTCLGITRILDLLDIDSRHINKFLELDNCILSSLNEDETIEYYSVLQRNYTSWYVQCVDTFTSRLLKKIYTILSPTKTQDEITKIFLELTQASNEKVSRWIDQCSKSCMFGVDLNYSIQNSLLLYLHTLSPEECSSLVEYYPFDLHPNVKRYYEQLTNVISNPFPSCSTYILSEYLLSHNCDISKLNTEQLQNLDTEVKNFINYQLYKLSHNLN